MILITTIIAQNDVNTMLGAFTSTSDGIEWYKKLSIEQKMGLKECTHLITGIKWEDFTIIFSPRERIEILYNKLKIEGFYV
jgi:hypothetical protein